MVLSLPSDHRERTPTPPHPTPPHPTPPSAPRCAAAKDRRIAELTAELADVRHHAEQRMRAAAVDAEADRRRAVDAAERHAREELTRTVQVGVGCGCVVWISRWGGVGRGVGVCGQKRGKKCSLSEYFSIHHECENICVSNGPMMILCI